MNDSSACRESVERNVELRDGRIVQFRNVRSSDAELFLGFFDGLSAESRDFMHGWSTRCDRKQAESIAAQAGSGDRYGLVTLAPVSPKERIVGYSWISGIEGADIPLLGIGVIDEYHNVGLGRALLRLMIDDARRLGLERVRLGVWADNPRAIHVYKSVGFKSDPAIPPKDFDGRTELYLVFETGK
jgi:ribosomal protein S18 acetylase RimI-like enzyme